MKRTLTLFLFSAVSFIGISQSFTFRQLDFNNVDAMLSDGGIFFNEEILGLPHYNIPKGSNLNAICAMSFWYAGEDVNGQLKLSAQLYDSFSDQFEGPLTIDGNATADVSGAWNISIFDVNRFEIEDHIANYSNVGYVPSTNIASWPGNGDVANGFDNYLAPFIDVDNDGIYDPLAGDYPCIRGDQAVYIIMNDKADAHASGGDPIGIEMHYMFYEYLGIPEIENTTFVHGKIINRGTQTLQNFKTSTFMDGDVGNYADDYFGSDSSRNMMFFYNGDNMDETGPGAQYAYMDNPPAIGIMSLTHDFESIGFTDGGTSTAADFWNAMNAKDLSGALWTNPATTSPTNFQYASDPESTVELDSEVALGNPPGDRRGVATINLGTLTPNDVHRFDYAVIYNRQSGNNIENASGLKDVADIVQEFFDTSFVDDCVQDELSLEDLSQTDFSIFPNPSQGEFIVSLAQDFSNAQAEILDISGRVVMSKLKLTSNETHIQLNEPSGVYLLRLTVDGHKATKRIILQ